SVCWLGLEVRFINSPPQRDGRVRVECEPPSVRPQNFIGAAPMCWANEPLLTNERQEKVLTRDSKTSPDPSLVRRGTTTSSTLVGGAFYWPRLEGRACEEIGITCGKER